MPTVAAVLGKVRDYLSHSEESYALKLNMGLALSMLYDQNQLYVNEMKLTQEGWLLKRLTLPVTTDSSEYAITTVDATATDFGGAFLVETDPAYYTTTSKRREVPVVNYQNADLVEPNYTVPSFSQGSDEPDTVTAIAFYNLDGAWKARTFPANAEGQYLVWYEPGVVADKALTAKPQMVEAFHGMLACSTARVLTGKAAWDGMPPAEAAEFRRELRDMLTGELNRWEMVWNRYRFQSHDEQPTHRLAFGRNRRAAQRRTRMTGF
jgi:hypothetical protein